MCVLCVSFGYNVRHRTFGCVAMGSAVFYYYFEVHIARIFCRIPLTTGSLKYLTTYLIMAKNNNRSSFHMF